MPVSFNEKIDIDEIQDSLSKAWGLPTSFYHDPDIHRLDLNAIFHRHWQYFGPAENLAKQGDVTVGRAGEVPVLVTRAEDGRLHGFVNVCRHRGYRVAAENKRNCKRLVCRYHAWSYRLNGEVAGAPGSENETDFPRSELSLIPVSVEEWGPAVFVNADGNARSFHESYPELVSEADRIGFDLDPSHYTFAREFVRDVPSNWKLWYDNFVECYHCKNIHSTSFAEAYDVDIESTDTQLIGRVMISRVPPSRAKDLESLRANNYRSFSMFPGCGMVQQDDVMILSQMVPTGPETLQHIVHYFHEQGADLTRVERWIDLWERTFNEDGAATAVQQQGIRTGFAKRHRLVASREAPVFHFNKLIAASYRAFLETLN